MKVNEFYGNRVRGRLAQALHQARSMSKNMDEELALLRALVARALDIMTAFQKAESLKGEVAAIELLQSLIGSVSDLIAKINGWQDTISPEQARDAIMSLVAVMQRHCSQEQMKWIARDWKIMPVGELLPESLTPRQAIYDEKRRREMEGRVSNMNNRDTKREFLT
jgi:hypothetical protein